MRNTQTTYKLTSLLFALTGLVTVMGRAPNSGMSAVWLSLSAVFAVFSQKAKSH